MASGKPTVVIAQGSFMTASFYDTLRTGLHDAGYPVVHPLLPSCSNAEEEDFPTRTLTDDALSITKAIERLLDEGKTVIVFMHSYGGLVGNQAIPENLSYTSREAKGEKGGVLHLFLCTAFLLQEGQTVLGVFGESPNNDVKPDGRFAIKNGATTLFNDLPDAEAALWESRLVPQSYQVQTTPITCTAYEYIPSTYLICENDQAVAVQYQEMFANMAKAEIQRCSAGHSAMLSQPGLLVERISAVAEKAAKQ